MRRGMIGRVGDKLTMWASPMLIYVYMYVDFMLITSSASNSRNRRNLRLRIKLPNLGTVSGL